jgi:putative ABC transport system permease protein
MRQLLVESGMIAFAGGALGLAAGFGGIRLLVLLAPQDIARGIVVTMDSRVMLFALGVTILSGIFFGLLPALQLSRTGHYEELKEGGRSGTAGRSRQFMRSALVCAEVAIALVLLLGAGLFLRSLARLQQVETGFDPSHLATGMVMLPDTQYKEAAQKSAFYRSVVDQIKNTPGVAAAAAIIPLPFSGADFGSSFAIEGRPSLPGDPGPHGSVRYISPDYFSTMGIPIHRGRAFTDQDTGKDLTVAIVDENLAARYWPNQDPIGQHLKNGGPKNPWQTIVGVVANVRHNGLSAETEEGVFYYPLYQSPVPMAAFVVKGTSGISAVRSAVQQVDSTQPLYDIKPMDQRVAESLGPRRFAVTLLAGFAVLALLLAALGIYGVISYSVTQRTQEIGIRMALGAERSGVLKLVVGHGLKLAGLGVAIGLIASAILTKLVASELFQVSRFDPLTFTVTAATLIAVSMLASYIPARRAMSVDPMIALRYE